MAKADTIFAPASGVGRAAIAVVRVSGPAAHCAVEALTRRRAEPDRRLALRRLRDPDSGEAIDDALVVCFAANASFTGEISAELHLHGGLAVTQAALKALATLGLRMAEPGEFARRAFENGRLDLAQLEGVADLVDAETEAQRRQALRQMDGALSRKAALWRERLIGSLAAIEAVIEFGDDLAADEGETPIAALQALAGELEREAAGVAAARRVREGLVVALLGPPNVGKSSLMNLIARRDVALVSEIAGTTRDVIETRCDLGGAPVTFLDMAGIRESDDPVERAGVARARARAAEADLRIVLAAPECGEAFDLAQPGDLRVMNKIDLEGARAPTGALGISAVSGVGLDALLREVATWAQNRIADAGRASTERHRAALERARAHVLASCERRDELAAEELRLACRALDGLLGKIDVEEVLDDIFARFCIGK